MLEKIQDIFIGEKIFSELYLFNVGHEVCESSHDYGPNIRENYLIHYVVRGKGRFEVDNKCYHVKSGEFFLIRPQEFTYYQADKEFPWEYYWLGFNGEKVEELLSTRHVGKDINVGKLRCNENDVKQLFDNLLACEFYKEGEKFHIYGLFYQALSLLDGGKLLEAESSNQMKKKRYSETFVLHVQNNYYQSQLSIQSIARLMNLNAAYLSQVIKEELGMSPSSYLKSFRLEKACRLLETTQLSIYEIANLVGYENQPSFTRAFKQKYGCPPSEYVII